jgi:hypothetical protein
MERTTTSTLVMTCDRHVSQHRMDRRVRARSSKLYSHPIYKCGYRIETPNQSTANDPVARYPLSKLSGAMDVASSDSRPSVAALRSRSLSIRTPRAPAASLADDSAAGEEPVTPNARLMESVYIVVTLGLGSPINLPVFCADIPSIVARYPRFKCIQVLLARRPAHKLYTTFGVYFDVLL